MTAKERYAYIKQKLEQDGQVFVTELSELFNITEETVRRDIDKLQMAGVAKKVIGGAILNVENKRRNIHFYQRESENREKKRHIAEKATELLKGPCEIAVDSGTTGFELLRQIRDREDIRVLTNSSIVLHEFSESKIKLLSTGGMLNKDLLSLQGMIAKNAIGSCYLGYAFISSYGLSAEKGILDSYEEEAELKRIIMKQSDVVVLMVDSSKFNRTALVKIGDFKDIDYLITDKKPSDEWMDYLQQQGVKVLY